jgi:hypothetical protein
MIVGAELAALAENGNEQAAKMRSQARPLQIEALFR